LNRIIARENASKGHPFDNQSFTPKLKVSLVLQSSPDDLLNSASREPLRLCAALFPFLQGAFRNLQL
jgi:hypothetical protein